MNITSAQYQQDVEGDNCAVQAVIDGVTWSVPMDTSNTQYQAILEWAKEDGNDIQEAE